jgi:hypothetical protein
MRIVKPAALALCLLAGGAARAPGYRGAQFEVRWGVAHRLSLGFATSWTWLAQNFPMHTIHYPNATVTAPVYQRAQFIGLRATGHWYLSDGWVQPYLGLGVGGAWTGTYRSVSNLTTSSDGLAAAADPQVGLLITVMPGLALHLQARYQIALARLADFENARWLGLDVGLAAF